MTASCCESDNWLFVLRRGCATQGFSELSGILHGGFNMKVLDDDKVEEVIEAEAVLDSLTLIEIGYANTIAVIGIDNELIMEAVARSGKKVAIALDNDIAGWESTLRMTEKLRQKGVLDVRDFTADFIKAHPEENFTDDWNEYWKRKHTKGV